MDFDVAGALTVRMEIAMGIRREAWGRPGDLTPQTAPTGVEVFFGATQSAFLGVATGAANRTRINFTEVVPSIRSSTLVFGLARLFAAVLAVLLVASGCERHAAPHVDAGTDLVDATPEDAPAPTVDEGAPFDSGSRPDVEFRDEPTVDAVAAIDRASVTDARNDAPTLADGGVIDPTMLGPARQVRAACPEPLDGDPAIAAPRLVFPLSPMRVTSRRPTLRWELPEGVTGARVELCRDRCCRMVIATLDATGTSARPAEVLPPGVVFWRARGMRDGRVGRATSFTWEFGVRRRDFPVDTAWGTIKDFDGDGYDDVFASIRDRDGNGRLLIYRGAPGPMPAERLTSRVNGSIGTLTTADFDGDGLADVYLAFVLRSSLAVASEIIRGRSSGQPEPSIRLGSVGGNGTVGDFNGDGFSDVVTRRPVSLSKPAVSVIHDVIYGGPSGLGSSGSTVVPDPLPIRRVTAFAAGTSPGDIDGDGYADAVFADPFANDLAGRVWVFRGSADGLSATPWRELPAADSRPNDFWGDASHAIGDVNADGVSDFGVSRGNSMYMRVYFGSRGGPTGVTDLGPPEPLQEFDADTYFTELGTVAPSLTATGTHAILIGCYLCVERVDIARPLPNGRVYQFDWDGNAIIRNPVRTLSTGAPYGAAFGFRVNGVGDVNGDGYDDIAIADVTPVPGISAPAGFGKIYIGLGSESGWDWQARAPLVDDARYEYGILGGRLTLNVYDVIPAGGGHG